jgi:periplasmic protein TonB
MEHISKVKRMLVSIISMTLGTVLVLFTILIINTYSEGPKEEKKVVSTSFEVKKEPKKKKNERNIERRKVTKQTSSRSVRSIAPSLTSFSGGIDFGLPEFAIDTGSIVTDKIIGNVDNVVMTAESVDIKPVAGTRVPAQYPEKARKKGITGYVSFNILISAEGNVEDIRVLESSPSGVFEESAMEALKNWKFEPAVYQGKKVKVWAKQKISFKLE